MPSVSTLVGTSVGPNCSVSSPQIIYISWHFASGAAPGKSTSSCTLTCTVNSGGPAVGWPEGSVEARTPLSPVWSSYRDFGLMEHDSWAPGFLGAHLWHFLFHYSHIVRVISREPPTIWCIIRQKCCREARKPVPGNHFFSPPSTGDCLPSAPESIILLLAWKSRLVAFHSFVLPWKWIYSVFLKTNLPSCLYCHLVF